MLDPFQVLGLPRSFAIDLRAVEKAHRELSRALHPDKYASTGASERRDALNKAADVNEAWRIVRDPVRRAEALFQLAGVDVGETKEPKPDPELLMEVLEKREALADAKSARDEAAVRALEEEIAAREKRIEETLAQAKTFDSALVPKLGELRFYRRFLDEADAVLDALRDL
jgi:molecular chaperone HscB